MNTLAMYIKDRWALWLALLLFIAFKIPHLSYPLFWDESWVYAPAAKEMYKAGPSLMPSAIAVDFSRGHPLLFHFLESGWMKIFGTSNVAMHSYPLFLSVMLLVSTYEIAQRLFNKRTAVAALLIISTQVIFFVRSAFVLLEIQLALFGMLAIWFYCGRRYLLTTLFLAAVFFTKESGLVLGGILGGDAFITLFKRKVTGRQKWMGFLSVTASFVLIGFFSWCRNCSAAGLCTHCIPVW